MQDNNNEQPQTPEPDARPRVSMDAEAWSSIDALLLDLPYRRAAPIVGLIQRTGGVQDMPQH